MSGTSSTSGAIEEMSSVGLLSLWRRPAHLHWYALCANGSKTPADDNSPALPASDRPWLPRGTGRFDYTAPEKWSARHTGTSHHRWRCDKVEPAFAGTSVKSTCTRRTPGLPGRTHGTFRLFATMKKSLLCVGARFIAPRGVVGQAMARES